MKEIVLGDSTMVSELAGALHESATAIVKVAFTELGLLATIHEPLSFEQASAIAARFGFSCRRRSGRDPA